MTKPTRRSTLLLRPECTSKRPSRRPTRVRRSSASWTATWPISRPGSRRIGASCWRLIPSWPRSSRRAWPASSSSTARPVRPAEEPATLGEFRIVRELGRGGMGVVYEAEQTSLRRRVALKVLRFGVVADEEAMQRFRREAETVARLHHTNIVPIFAVGCERGVHYYAMQFIEGRSLADVLDESPAIRQAAVAAGRRPLGPPGRRGPGPCPPARGDPPRHQAFEPAARRRGRRLADRFRPGQAGRRGDADRQRRSDGHAAVHEPRAGRVAPAPDRSPDRPLQPGRDALRAGHGPARLRVGDAARRHRADPRPRSRRGRGRSGPTCRATWRRSS